VVRSAPIAQEWVISDPDSNPEIVDVIAEGTSFRLTQRSDYASFLAHNVASACASRSLCFPCTISMFLD